MSYQRERDEFIAQASGEGLSLPVITKLLRHASTLQRLAVAQCNGDWPYNGDRDRPYRPLGGGMVESDESIERRRVAWDKRYTVCPKCETSGVARSALRTSNECRVTPSGVLTTDGKLGDRAKVCPDCRTQELVRELLNQVQRDCQHDSKSMFPVACVCVIEPVFGGDPRGAVLRLSTPRFPYRDDGANGARGLYVPARER